MVGLHLSTSQRSLNTCPEAPEMASTLFIQGFPRGSDGKESACSAGDLGFGRSPGEGNGNPLQYSCLENPMDRGAQRATVHGVTESQTGLRLIHTHTTMLFIQIHISWLVFVLRQFACERGVQKERSSPLSYSGAQRIALRICQSFHRASSLPSVSVPVTWLFTLHPQLLFRALHPCSVCWEL